MNSVEISAKTVEEAIEIAIKELGAQRDEVEVEVISKGKSGILGLGAEPARVRVTRIAQALDTTKVAREVIETLIRLTGVTAQVHLQAPQAKDAQGPPPTVFNLVGEDSGLLIGRRGETLGSLQFLVNLMASRRLKERVSVTVDVEEYRQRRQEALTNLALRLADRAATTGRTIALEPMPANERRLVHLALADHPRVSSQSIGYGDERKVVIIPRGRQVQERPSEERQAEPFSE